MNYVLLIIVVLVLIIVIPLPWSGWDNIWYQNIHRLYEFGIKKRHQWLSHPLDKEACYQNLKTIDLLFKSAAIPYWITDGTGLGMIRDGDFIEWDDDVDLGVDVRYLPKFLDLLPVLKEHGFLLTRIEMDGTFFALVRNNEKVDIDFVGPGLFCAAAENTCPGNKCPCDNIIPYLKDFVSIQYRDLTLLAPNETYLELIYGKDWRVPKKSKF